MENVTNKEPLISVIMGIYNCTDTLEEAVECIINQTYKNWELIMCDDCSKDSTFEIAKRYAERYPNQVVLLRNEKNMGLNYTLNKCLAVAKGEYIARMDGDDLCDPERFEKERTILDQNPEIAIVSTDMMFFDDAGTWGKTNALEKPVAKDFLKCTRFCHAACMVRREAFDAVNGYSISNRLLRVEDYHLWIKMYEMGYVGVNIQEPLYSMRDDRNAQKRKQFKYRLNEAYVKAYAVKHLKLSRTGYIYCLKPLIVGLMPGFMYRIIHRKTRGERR